VPTRQVLALTLSAALAVRLWSVASHSYIVWPDETFQYLEPAHRLLFGSGVITWEFLDGIRSWFLPALLAGVMWLAARVDADPAAYVLVPRLVCVLASLSVPLVAVQLTARRCGPAPALLAGLLGAFATETIYFAPVIMAEPLATDAALLAIWLGDGAREQGGREQPAGRRRLLAAGLLFGLACSLRYQYAPALAVAALVQHARAPRALAMVAAGASAVVVPVLGGLDALTWGAPFQSVWLNYTRNATQGIGAAMGRQPWCYYPGYYLAAWGVAAPALLAVCLLGAVRAPVLGAVVLCTVGLHSLTPHKEPRFVFLATACMPMLLGMGLASLPRLGLIRRNAPAAAALALALAAWLAITTYARATPGDAWHRDRAMLQATAAARGVPGACALAIRGIWVYRSGGYTYWHRDLPIYFETWDAAQSLDRSTVRLRLDSVLAGRPVPQYPGAALAANSFRFNVMLGRPGDGLPGFTENACFGADAPEAPEVCVFTRPGGCE
jgi:hypothetical protein